MENVLRFEHPEYLYWLLIIPVLVIIYILFRLGQKRRFERFAHIGMREQLVPSYWPWPTCRAAARWRR